MTLQWAGEADELATQLAPAGWHRPAPWTLRSALVWAEDAPDANALPVLPRLHQGLPPVLTLVRPDDGCPARTCVLVLRLWRSRTILVGEEGISRTVLVGTVTRQALRRPVPFLMVSVPLPDANGPRDAIAQALGLGRTMMRHTTSMAFNPDWDGRVLLAPHPVVFVPRRTDLEEQPRNWP